MQRFNVPVKIKEIPAINQLNLKPEFNPNHEP